MKQIALCVFLALLLYNPHHAMADSFEFKQKIGDKFRFISTTREEVYQNGKLIQISNLVDRMASEIIKIDNDIAWHNVTFNLAEEIVDGDKANQLESKRLQWKEEEYTAVFGRDKRGKMIMDKKYFMPSVRDIPHFPEIDIQEGYTWETQGNEVLDLRALFEIKEPYEIPFSAHNAYFGNANRNNKTYKLFTVNYTFSKRVSIDGFEDFPRDYLLKDRTNVAPAAKAIRTIRGKSSQVIYWDEKLGNIAAAEDEFELRFELTNGEVYLFKGKTYSEMLEANVLNREETARDVEETLHDLGIEDVNVRVVDEGIAISLENIQFAPDSADLLPSEEEKLEKISSILRKYNERDILVSGHTALAGRAEFRGPLSEQRAAAVASYFIMKKVRPANRIISRGYGSSRPVAGNDTEEGRRKNRRVEITILEN
ncbi:MAG: OmpA family protein [Spirochaetaceae bacterium]|jgi:outer membrane protein OmpA-like peptidoglycan-associated protein|nr:OmpA family protein [Spirochaetaceae bacterium]